jgi:hypothetical protein
VYEEVSAVRPVFLVQQKDVLLEDVQRRHEKVFVEFSVAPRCDQSLSVCFGSLQSVKKRYIGRVRYDEWVEFHGRVHSLREGSLLHFGEGRDEHPFWVCKSCFARWGVRSGERRSETVHWHYLSARERSLHFWERTVVVRSKQYS